MANWYVDSAATGTGSGDTPTNAAINVTSLCGTLNVNSDVGAMIWVRRSFFVDNSDARSLALGINSLNVNSHQPTWIIGWPKSGDMFYDQRPAAGVSAGWDADAQIWPTIACSGAISISNALSRMMTYVTNWVLTNSSATAMNIGDFFATNLASYVGDIVSLNRFSFTVSRPVNHLIMVTSCGNQYMLSEAYRARRITIAQSTYYSGDPASGWGALGLATIGGRIEEVVNLSNSVSCLFNVRLSNAAAIGISLGRIRGNRANIIDIVGDNASTNYGSILVDDFYGQGPRRLLTRNDGSYRGVSSATYVSSRTAWRTHQNSWDSFSISVTNKEYANRFADVPHVFQSIQCTSGVPLSMKLHFCTASGCGSIDQFPGLPRFFAPTEGGEQFCTIANSGIQPGSSTLWTGSLTAIESYYMMYGKFTPTETAQIWIGAYLPPKNMNQYAHMYYSPMIEVGS